MGREARCTGHFGDVEAEGKLSLEAGALRFSKLKLAIALPSIRSLAAERGALRVAFPNGEAWFDLGQTIAERWVEAIDRERKSPKSVLDKLGVKRGQCVVLIGDFEASFLADLEARGVTPSDAKSDVDALFVHVTTEKQLQKLTTLRKRLRPDGALWVVRRKGRDAPVSECAAMAAGKAAGLVDVKVVAFSATLTAEKFVIPVASR